MSTVEDYVYYGPPMTYRGYRRTCRLLRDARLFQRYRDPEFTRGGFGAQVVLSNVVDLVVCAGNGDEYRPDPERDGRSTLAERVGRHMRYRGGEDEIERDLGKLERAEMIVRLDDGGVRLGDCVELDRLG